jgi:hypothetical protein
MQFFFVRCSLKNVFRANEEVIFNLNIWGRGIKAKHGIGIGERPVSLIGRLTKLVRNIISFRAENVNN